MILSLKKKYSAHKTLEGRMPNGYTDYLWMVGLEWGGAESRVRLAGFKFRFYHLLVGLLLTLVTRVTTLGNLLNPSVFSLYKKDTNNICLIRSLWELNEEVDICLYCFYKYFSVPSLPKFSSIDTFSLNSGKKYKE